jgi:hypothetical protein
MYQLIKYWLRFRDLIVTQRILTLSYLILQITLSRFFYSSSLTSENTTCQKILIIHQSHPVLKIQDFLDQDYRCGMNH